MPRDTPAGNRFVKPLQKPITSDPPARRIDQPTIELAPKTNTAIAVEHKPALRIGGGIAAARAIQYAASHAAISAISDDDSRSRSRAPRVSAASHTPRSCAQRSGARITCSHKDFGPLRKSRVA